MGTVHVEIVAKQKGCILCDLAIGILEEIAPEFEPGLLRWSVVDVGDRTGLIRMDELSRCCGKRPAIPSIVINGKIAFDHIPDMDALTLAVRNIIVGDTEAAH
ncbi:MAG: hypothetical protein AB7S77_08340 [Desulfatirhabdiaceae bacterium]